MINLKIDLLAYGCTGTEYDGKETQSEKTIKKHNSEEELHEKDLQNCIETMIEMVKDTKSKYPDERDHKKGGATNRVEELCFEIELIDKHENTLHIFNEYNLFDQASEYESLHPLMFEFTKITDNGEDGARTWMNDETPAGTSAMMALVLNNRKWIPEYINFLRTNDMENEVEQTNDIQSIIEKYEWRRSTTKLAIARLVGCCGQGGVDQFKSFLKEGLGDYIEDQTNRAQFLKDILEEFESIDKSEQGQQLLKEDKEAYLKKRSEQIDRFEIVLSSKERLILKSELAQKCA